MVAFLRTLKVLVTLPFLTVPFLVLAQPSFPVSIDTDTVIATTGPRFVAFGLEMWQMLSMLTNNDFTDTRLLQATSALAGSTIRIGGITADWLCYVTDTTDTTDSSITSGKSSTELSTLAIQTRLGDFWPSQCENITMPQFRTLLGFFEAAGWSVVFDLNELHGRNCTNPNPNYPVSKEWCSGAWDTSNMRSFLQYIYDNNLIGGTSPLFGFELGNELHGHLNYTDNIQDILTLVDIVKSIWNGNNEDHSLSSFIPPVYAPSTDDCYDNDTFTIMNSIADAATGFTYHAYPGQSGTGIDNLTFLLLNTTWLRTGILTGSNSNNCINHWINDGSKNKGLDLWVTESSSSWNYSLTEPAQDSFLHGFFTLPELGQYATTGVNMVARWSFSEGSPFGTLKFNNTAKQWDASVDYYILTIYNTVVGHQVLQVQGNENSETALVYAHCSSTGQGEITLFAVNPTDQTIVINPTDSRTGNSLPVTPRVEYIFTAIDNNFASFTPLLNGGIAVPPLRLAPDGTPPIMPGNVVNNGPVTLPPYSQAFYVLLGTNATACCYDTVRISCVRTERKLEESEGLTSCPTNDAYRYFSPFPIRILIHSHSCSSPLPSSSSSFSSLASSITQSILLITTFLSFLSSSAVAFTSSPLYVAYSGNPRCYRQPILTFTNQGAPSPSQPSILAFIEGRNISYCSGTDWPDVVDFPIRVRTSFDGGQSFSDTVDIVHGNYDFLVVVTDQSSGRVYLLLQYGDNGIQSLYSDDAGITWTSPVNVTVTNLNAYNLSSVIPGVGHGVQISPAYCLDATCGNTAGRLVLPFVCTLAGPVTNDTACGNCRTCLLLSDDYGTSWRLGALSNQDGSREASLVQLDNGPYPSLKGIIYATERNLGNATGTRWHSISLDGGETFTSSYSSFDINLPDGVTANWTGVVAGASRFDTYASSTSAVTERVIFTTPANRTDRSNLSLFVSLDGTQTWLDQSTLLWDGPSAYSDIYQYNSTHAAVIFECGTDEFAQQINFGFVTVNDLPSA